MERVETGYMCKTDFDFELGHACGGNKVYPSIEDLKENRKCVEQCGIVKVEVKLLEVIQEENYDDRKQLKDETSL